jgi:hypothetical protein
VDVQRRLVDPHRQIGALGAQAADDRAREKPEEGPELRRLDGFELPERLTVLLRLDDDGAGSEWADAVLGAPRRRLRDQSAGNRNAPRRRVAGQATVDVRYGGDVPSRP